MDAECTTYMNHGIKVNKVAAMLDNSHGSVHLMIYKMLLVYKVSGRQVPRQLTPTVGIKAGSPAASLKQSRQANNATIQAH